MEIRRPLAALFAALALFGGSATLTACSDSDPTTPNEGTTDDDSGNTGGDERDEQDDLPSNSDPEQDSEDSDDDTVDPD